MQEIKARVYVDRLFMDYEDSPTIRDFKEEITSNLEERVKEFMSNGLDEEKSFEKATEELGDITTLADDVGKRKRNEAIGQMYINTKVPISKKSAFGYTLATGILLFGIIIGILTFFSSRDISEAFLTSAVFVAIACTLFTLVGLTQETSSHYPMKFRRAFLYAISCGCAVFGAFIAISQFTTDYNDVDSGLGIILAFVIPAICILVFLLTTESRREKPWLKAVIDSENIQADPMKAAKFGVASGGLWIFAIALFATLGLIIGWQYSWLVFLFTIAIQMFMVTMIFEKKSK